MKKILFCLSVMSLAFPVAAQDLPSSTADATIYVYRLRDGYAAILKPSVFCDSKQIVRMRNGRFTSIHLAPGSHTITSTFPGNGVAIDTKPGETYYIRLSMSPATFMHASRGQVTQVVEGQGKFEVSQLKPVEAEDLKVEEVAQP